MIESPKQYSARRIRVAIEKAKIAIMEIEEELLDFRGDPADYYQATAAASARLDVAWRLAAEREKAKAHADG